MGVTASLCHVQAVNLLGLLRRLRYHADYSSPMAIALRRVGLGNPHLATVLIAR